MKNTKWINWISLFTGIWVFFVPWFVGISYTDLGMSLLTWNFWIVGAIVMFVSVLALNDTKPWEEWLNLSLGIWLFISPWFLGFYDETILVWNALFTGIIIAMISGIAIPTASKTQEPLK